MRILPIPPAESVHAEIVSLETAMNKKLTFVYFDAGGGHRSAATALAEVIEREGRPWDITLLNLQELLDDLDPIKKVTGARVQDTYNAMLETGRTFGATYMLRAFHLLVRLYHRAVVAALQRHWEGTRPEMVVSLIPNFNRAIAESMQRALPGAPFVTILTDFADYPPHFWIERQSDFLICGTETAVRQARSLGHGQDRVFRASGMILNPRFYEPLNVDRAAEREELGLDPNLPTGIVLFGGYGAPVMRDIVEELDRARLDLQLILICGRNQALATVLRNMQTRMPVCVEGFTRQVPYYMHLSDFFIGKTGPGSISEAVAMRLPVIVESNARTLPQERYNASWVSGNGVGMVLGSFREIEPAVRRLLRPGVLADFRAHTAAIDNRAVFEIPTFLDRIFELAGERSACPANMPGYNGQSAICGTGDQQSALVFRT
jgi:1,2-diacylglycerol 3-beta-galactosyltransferase